MLRYLVLYPNYALDESRDSPVLRTNFRVSISIAISLLQDLQKQKSWSHPFAAAR